jgi:RNA polymerase primary sigma factor
MLSDGRGKRPEDTAREAQDLHRVRDLLGRLDRREATVLRMRFGLDGEEPTSLREAGERLRLTGERVRQIEIQALRKLSENIHVD